MERWSLCLEVISAKYRQYIKVRGDWDMLVECDCVRIRPETK